MIALTKLIGEIRYTCLECTIQTLNVLVRHWQHNVFYPFLRHYRILSCRRSRKIDLSCIFFAYMTASKMYNLPLTPVFRTCTYLANSISALVTINLDFNEWIDFDESVWVFVLLSWMCYRARLNGTMFNVKPLLTISIKCA